MRRNILICSRIKLFVLIYLLSQLNFISAQNFEIKSLRIYSSADQIEFPVIDYSEKSIAGITIEFDVQSKFIPNLNILFKFCDANWIPYENAFLINPMYNTENNLWFDRLPSTVRDARFHYKGSFPNNNVNFPFSGNWMFFIVDSQNRNKAYASGRFYVVNPEVKLTTQLLAEGSEGNIPEQNALRRTFSIRTNFSIPDTLFPANVSHVEIIQNRKFYYPIVIDRNTFTPDRFYEWNASDNFSFVARNIKPGNEYRQTDIRDAGTYSSSTVSSKFGEIETSNFYNKGKQDLNGSSYLVDFRNEDAVYLNVVFKIRPPENIKSPIFLAGSFNNWIVSPKYEMFDDNGMMNLSLQLKRGIYDYQYVTGEVAGDHIENINWEILEGNFWETRNEYFIFLYYKTIEKGGYDKIIGYKKIMSNSL
jgi:hypothetical protein